MAIAKCPHTVHNSFEEQTFFLRKNAEPKGPKVGKTSSRDTNDTLGVFFAGIYDGMSPGNSASFDFIWHGSNFRPFFLFRRLFSFPIYTDLYPRLRHKSLMDAFDTY